VLRVKTSSLPITVTTAQAGARAGRWTTEADDAQGLRMRRLAPDGTLLATLVASASAPAPRSPAAA
jgi:hypothetical protein